MAGLYQRKFAVADALACVHPGCTAPAEAVSVTVAVFDDRPTPTIKVQPMCSDHMREVDAIYDRFESDMDALVSESALKEITVTVSETTYALLEEVAELGVYGIGVPGVVEGFIYRGLQTVVQTPEDPISAKVRP